MPHASDERSLFDFGADPDNHPRPGIFKGIFTAAG